MWESKADGAFAISEDTWNEPLGRGTEIRLHLRDEAQEYLEEGKLKVSSVCFPRDLLLIILLMFVICQHGSGLNLYCSIDLEYLQCIFLVSTYLLCVTHFSC